MGKGLPGRKRILFLEDDDILRNAAARFLKRSGYEVELAQDGSEVLELYRKAGNSGTPFSAVVLDLTIPGGMGGKETIAKILKLDPGAKVIVSSGYSNDQVMSRYEDFGFKGAVSKPYQLQDLSRALDELLNKKGG